MASYNTTTSLDVIPCYIRPELLKNEVSIMSREKGYKYFMEGYIHAIKFECTAINEVSTAAKCYRSQRKSEKPHSLNIILDTSKEVLTEVLCTCKAGLSGCCSHIYGLMCTLQHFKRAGIKELPGQASATSLPQQWHKPRGKKISAEPVTNMIIAKAKEEIKRKKQPVLSSLNNTRNIEVTSEDIRTLQDLTNTPMAYLLQDNIPEIDTKYGKMQDGSAAIYHVMNYRTNRDHVGPTSCGDINMPRESSMHLPPWMTLLNSNTPLTIEDSIKLEKATTAQASCEVWVRERAMRLTASNFAKVLKRKKKVNKSFLDLIFKGKSFQTNATEWGKSHETDAKSKYMEIYKDRHVHDCGLVVNPKFSFLGATPDGKVCHQNTTGIIEIKCPYSARNLTIKEAVEKVTNFCLFRYEDVIAIKETHDHYYQIQGQLLITGAPFCDFIVYTTMDIFIERVLPDRQFIQAMLLKLSLFFKGFAIPYFYSTYCRNEAELIEFLKYQNFLK